MSLLPVNNFSIPKHQPFNEDPLALMARKRILIVQRREIAEFFGIESRNKYEIRGEDGAIIGFAAEQNKDFWGFITRQFFGHWRTFEIHIFSANREPLFQAFHPFRWYYQRLELSSAKGVVVGALQRRFELFNKYFAVESSGGATLLEATASFWRFFSFWNVPFLFKKHGRQMASVSRKWSGIFNEMFTDADKFLIDFEAADLNLEERYLVLAGALYVDLLYFERKAGSRNNGGFNLPISFD